jgi:polar amino acid transport system ATP-binding protein
MLEKLLKRGSGMLKIKELSKSFLEHTVIDNLSFESEGAQVIGLAGASGSGKSTLLRLIQKIEIPDSGTIETHGRTGFMFQDFQLFPHMTVWENIIYAPAMADKTKSYLTRATEIVENLGLSSKKHAYPSQLSGGQKQRVALARSLMMQPELLLCDEPTSGLDVATIQDVIALLESVKKRGVIIVIASHDLDFLTKIADKIIVLKAGKLVDQVLPKDMVDPIGYLKNLYYEAE